MSTTITLPAVLDILHAESLRTELLAVRGQAVAIDGSAVERLGGLCLQVLLSPTLSRLRPGLTPSNLLRVCEQLGK